jgi:hypothetical protein
MPRITSCRATGSTAGQLVGPRAALRALHTAAAASSSGSWSLPQVTHLLVLLKVVSHVDPSCQRPAQVDLRLHL